MAKKKKKAKKSSLVAEKPQVEVIVDPVKIFRCKHCRKCYESTTFMDCPHCGYESTFKVK